MSNIIPFDFNGSQVRVTDMEGNPWFVAKDVCLILGFRDAFNGTRYLDEEEKATLIQSTPGGDQEVTIISESGLYSLVLRSRKPEAKAFKKWVTRDVLPAIRKTGAYVSPAMTGQDVIRLGQANDGIILFPVSLHATIAVNIIPGHHRMYRKQHKSNHDLFVSKAPGFLSLIYISYNTPFPGLHPFPYKHRNCYQK